MREIASLIQRAPSTVSHAKDRLGHSERRICRALGISRSAVRYEPHPRVDESALTGSIVGLAGQYGRYGYRRVHALIYWPLHLQSIGKSAANRPSDTVSWPCDVRHKRHSETPANTVQASAAASCKFLKIRLNPRVTKW